MCVVYHGCAVLFIRTHSLDCTRKLRRALRAAAKIDYVKNVAVAQGGRKQQRIHLKHEERKNASSTCSIPFGFYNCDLFFVHSLSSSLVFFARLLAHSLNNFCKQFARTVKLLIEDANLLILLLHMATTERWIKQPKLSAVLFQKFMSVQFPRLIWFLFLLLIVISFPSCW